MQLLLDLGLKPTESGEHFVARAERAIQFWSEGVGALPEDWDLYVPEHLVGTHVRSKPVLAHARVSSGVDWLNVKISYEAEGVGVDREELERCLREGRKFVKLSDNSFAPFDADSIQQMIDREVELIAAGGKNGKIPLSQAGSVQDLIQQATSGDRGGDATNPCSRSSRRSTRSRPPRSRRGSKRRCVRTRSRAYRGCNSSTR